jgi:type II secretory pathway pseudopilin PulG
MELKKLNKWSKQRGTSLIELMIACLVLMVGVAGTVTLIPIAIGANSRNRQQSNSTVIAQMVIEKMLSAPVGGAGPVLTINDCTPTTYNITTAVGGAPLLASGDVNFAAAAPAGYGMLYTACGAAGGGQSVYDVRWNIQQPAGTTFVKLITVSAKLRGSGTDLRYFSLPVTIRSTAGQGS